MARVARRQRVPAGGARGQGRRRHRPPRRDHQAPLRRDPRPRPRPRRPARRLQPDCKTPAPSLRKILFRSSYRFLWFVFMMTLESEPRHLAINEGDALMFCCSFVCSVNCEATKQSSVQSACSIVYLSMRT